MENWTVAETMLKISDKISRKSCNPEIKLRNFSNKDLIKCPKPYCITSPKPQDLIPLRNQT